MCYCGKSCNILPVPEHASAIANAQVRRWSKPCDFQKVWCVRETKIVVENKSPEGVFVYDRAGVVINKFSNCGQMLADPT